MSSRQFVRYIGELKAVDPRELDERVDRALVMCGLDPACNRTLSRRSEGERRRTGLAAAVVAWPRVAILDEPMRSSDPIERLRCKGLLRALADAGAVCIVASSAISDVDGLCDRLLVLDGGRLAFAGAPHELTWSRLSSPLSFRRSLRPSTTNWDSRYGYSKRLTPSGWDDACPRCHSTRLDPLPRMGPRKALA